MRKSKILCTMGPACDSDEILYEMIHSGMNIARLNMAHGELDEHRIRIENIRKAALKQNTFIPVLLDIKGPEIRIGKLKDPYVELIQDSEIVITTNQILGNSNMISVNYEDMPNVLKPSSRILIDDGLIELSVISIKGQDIYCKVLNGGIVKPRKGVNLPGVRTTLPGITERDVNHILFGLDNKIDIIAVSFVRKAEDILAVRRILKENKAEQVQIIAKIENEEGVSQLDEIIKVSDGIMVARGDLGVEIPVEEVPLVQKKIVEKCNGAGKPVIVATHLLDSMQLNPRPTRAEVSDVSTAVLQGADVLMLSGETAAGKYPVESVRTMATVAEKMESCLDHAEQFSKRRAQHAINITEVISQSAVSSSFELNAKAIITPTESGYTARMVSKYRPMAPIIAITRHPDILRKLCLLWGVIPVLGDTALNTDDMFDSAINNSIRTGLIKKGDYVIISAGVPIGKEGTTNILKVQEL
ncbi:pyruvate kinase [Paenibacillus dokdonensis]|uniref:pyruvate kinase n=1 Tax=Paenibacillus dokdonensis TaxID=2567944 RepID=UPI0010A8A5AC|nr:pyruvate kinase [Paenibacillus dokdonensis]